MERLDATDELILAELAEDARATYAEIGGRVNLSAPAVKRRVDRMLDSGVMAVRSLKDGDAVRFARMQSIAEPLAALAGPWDA
jgi:predicted ArsR family transcriptional regulator